MAMLLDVLSELCVLIIGPWPLLETILIAAGRSPHVQNLELNWKRERERERERERKRG
jgi:hypothetical protein